MSQKPKLSAEQNLQLKGLDLQQKLELLYNWYKKGTVSKGAFEHLSNAWINRESKRESNLVAIPVHPWDNFERTCPYSAIEGQIQCFIEKLRGYIKDYISNRSKVGTMLTAKEIETFKNYVTTYFAVYPAKISRLLIIGLRYPDESKTINKFCADWIEKESLNHSKNYYDDSHFWSLLWEDGNLVPMDAIRLMLVQRDDVYSINPRFSPRTIKALLPYIAAQRDKEITRLKLAQMRDDGDHEAQVQRKMTRLKTFNLLISAAERFCNEANS